LLSSAKQILPHASVCHAPVARGMRREFSGKEAIDIYEHVDLKELKEAYLARIPQLVIYNLHFHSLCGNPNAYLFH